MFKFSFLRSLFFKPLSRVQYTLQRENDWDVDYLYQCVLYRDTYKLLPPTCYGGKYFDTEAEAIDTFHELYRESGCLAGELFFAYDGVEAIKVGEPYNPILGTVIYEED